VVGRAMTAEAAKTALMIVRSFIVEFSSSGRPLFQVVNVEIDEAGELVCIVKKNSQGRQITLYTFMFDHSRDV
jgi:ABC-type ATPase with predicted acetyltransferase domain